MNNKTIHRFHDLGLIEYQKAWDFQEKLFAENLRKKMAGLPTENHLIFCEHPHVYTLGKSGSENNLLANNAMLKKSGATFFKTNRGGDITYHGPGQIVGYPIFDLENFGLGVKEYIHFLEETIIVFLKDFGITGDRLDGATGVWLDPEEPGKARKICAIGVKASRHITMHGFAFNINTDLNFFNLINPCGFTDKAVTSLQKELNTEIDMKTAKKITLEKLKTIFDVG
jgi:lipoyl(octanoyl) transferase